MNYLNPNKYIRTGLIQALKLRVFGLNVWYKKVPLNKTPIPLMYVLLDSQTKNETVASKSTNERATVFEWLATININIYSLKDKGFSDADDVDDLEEKVLSVVRSGFAIPNFKTKDVRIIESIDLSTDTATHSVDRKAIKIEMWLNNVIA